MKTSQQVKEEINLLMSEFEKKKKNNPKLKSSSIKSKLDFFRRCQMYLDTHPREEFILNEIARVSTLIDSKSSSFDLWKKNNPYPLEKASSIKGIFERDMGLKDLKAQLKTLKFIAH